MTSVRELISAIRENSPDSIELLRDHIQQSSFVEEIEHIQDLVLPGKNPACWVILQSHLLDIGGTESDELLANVYAILRALGSSEFSIDSAYEVAVEFGALLKKIADILRAETMPSMHNNINKCLFDLCLKMTPGKISPIHALILERAFLTLGHQIYAKRLLKLSCYWDLDDNLDTSVEDIAAFFLAAASIMVDQEDYELAMQHYLTAMVCLMPLRDWNAKYNRPSKEGYPLQKDDQFDLISNRLTLVLLLFDRSSRALQAFCPDGPGHLPSVHQPTSLNRTDIDQVQKAVGNKDLKALHKLIIDYEDSFSQLGILELVKHIRISLITSHVLDYRSVYSCAKLSTVLPASDDLLQDGSDSDMLRFLQALRGVEIDEKGGLIDYFNKAEMTSRAHLKKLKAFADNLTRITSHLDSLTKNLPSVSSPSAFLTSPQGGRGEFSESNPDISSEALQKVERELRSLKQRRIKKKIQSFSPMKYTKLRSQGTSPYSEKWASSDVTTEVEDDQIMESDGVDSESD